jgi:Tol biopolymer transport system component
MPITRGDGVLDFAPDGGRFVYLDVQKPRNVKIGSLSYDAVFGDARVSQGDITSLTKNENLNVEYSSPLFSRDGSHIAIVSSERFYDKEQKPISRVQILGSDTIQDIFSTTERLHLIGWSSANEVVLATTKSRFATMPLDFDIVTAGLNGASSKLITLEGVYGETLTLSPDGGTLAYTARRDGRDDIWTLSLPHSAEPRKATLNPNAAFFLTNLAFSANGKTIYFDKQEESKTISMIENFN